MQMKLSELHDWHMFLTARQLGLNVNAKLLWMSSPIVQPMSDMTEWHDMICALWLKMFKGREIP